jgi:hypothetical protein
MYEEDRDTERLRVVCLVDPTIPASVAESIKLQALTPPNANDVFCTLDISQPLSLPTVLSTDRDYDREVSGGASFSPDPKEPQLARMARLFGSCVPPGYLFFFRGEPVLLMRPGRAPQYLYANCLDSESLINLLLHLRQHLAAPACCPPFSARVPY